MARALPVWWSAAAVGSGIRMLGQAPGAELGDGDHAGPRHHQVGHRVAVCHRVEEGNDLHVGRLVEVLELLVGAWSP